MVALCVAVWHLSACSLSHTGSVEVEESVDPTGLLQAECVCQTELSFRNKCASSQFIHDRSRGAVTFAHSSGRLGSPLCLNQWHHHLFTCVIFVQQEHLCDKNSQKWLSEKTFSHHCVWSLPLGEFTYLQWEVWSTWVHECHMTHSCACSGKRLSVRHQSVLSPHSEPHIFLLLHESRAELPGCRRDEEDPGARSTNDAVCFLFTLNVTKTRFSSCLLLNMNYSATLSSNCEELKLNVQSWSFSFMLWTWMLTWILPAAHRQTCIGSQPGHLTETW